MVMQLPRPAVFAHRGASLHAPENTISAFKLAVELGADGIELDVMLTRDQQIVVIHDSTLDRTTDVEGFVGEMDLNELCDLDAGSWFGDEFRFERIPTLEEVFLTVGGDTIINIELKNYNKVFNVLPEKVAELVNHMGLRERVFFSSFNPVALLRARRALPEVPVALLALPGRAGSWARGFLGRMIAPDFLHAESSDISPELLGRAHLQNRRIHSYTVNHPEDMRRLYSWGIDGIFSDDPALAIRIREEI
jgi:glycerophosphoryl diester phosphodiesterase